SERDDAQRDSRAPPAATARRFLERVLPIAERLGFEHGLDLRRRHRVLRDVELAELAEVGARVHRALLGLADHGCDRKRAERIGIRLEVSWPRILGWPRRN